MSAICFAACNHFLLGLWRTLHGKVGTQKRILITAECAKKSQRLLKHAKALAIGIGVVVGVARRRRSCRCSVLQMFKNSWSNGILIAWERWWKMPGFGTTDPGIYSETHQCITCIKIHHFGLDKTIVPSHSWRSRRRRSWGASVRIVWFGCGLGCGFMEYAYMISPGTHWLAAGNLKKWIYCKTIVSVDFPLSQANDSNYSNHVFGVSASRSTRACASHVVSCVLRGLGEGLGVQGIWRVAWTPLVFSCIFDVML